MFKRVTPVFGGQPRIVPLDIFHYILNMCIYIYMYIHLFLSIYLFVLFVYLLNYLFISTT